jgi:hypothetical protein
MERLKSRKWLTAIATILLIICNEMVGLNIPEEAYWAIILPAIAYILGEAYADGKAAGKNK